MGWDCCGEGVNDMIVLQLLSQWVLPLVILAFVAVFFWAILRSPRRTW